MNKLIITLILTYLCFTINSTSFAQSEENLEDKKVLKIGVLVPLSGEFQDIGESFLKAIQLGLYDISNKNIKIFPKDSKASASHTFMAAKEFEELGIKIVIGPVFYESLEKLNEISTITFVSLTNKTQKTPSNVITFGINIDSQIDILKEYFSEIDVSKSLLLYPKKKFINQTNIVRDSNLKFSKIFPYDISPKKITKEIQNLTKYNDRKKDLERRILILEKSDLYKDKQELKILEQKHTLGKVNFDSVLIVDFGERLKSVLTSFMFSDVSNEKVAFFTINQWFDETFFNESALQNLHFPAIDYKGLTKFNKKFFKAYNKKPNEISILAYDALGLIYSSWVNNDFKFKKDHLFNKKGFKGLHGKFFIEKNRSFQKLKIYKVVKKKFVKVY